MDYAIELSSLRKAFGSKVAVEHLDLKVERGSLIGLIGPNGAGKTTSIRMIMSIIFPDRGSLRVLGKASAVESKDRIGYLPEERGIYKKMKVGAFLKYVGRLKDLPDAGLERRVRDWLERVGLGDCYAKKCEELSKGMQQKVQFIAAIIHEPDLIILDEPFSGLDPVNSRMLRSLVDEQHRAGRTIVFSTHQMGQAEALCDRVVMIHQGKKVLDDTLDDIRARYTPREIEFEAAPGVWQRDGVQTLPGVESIAPHNGAFRASLQEGASPESVLRAIAGAVPVQRIEMVRPSLEDVFLEIVLGAAADPAERAALMNVMQSTSTARDMAGASWKKGAMSGD
jgi:ABC-2 type transport system ATP-binding protein